MCTVWSGRLSLLVGLTDPSSNLEGDSGNPDQSSRVQAVVDVFGPTDLTFCREKSSVAWIFRLFMGGTPSETAERYKAASPLTYVSEDDPPVLTLHGTEDALVPVEQARLLDKRMRDAGAFHSLVVFHGQGHGFRGDAQEGAMDAMWSFFGKYLKPVGTKADEAAFDRNALHSLEISTRLSLDKCIELVRDDPHFMVCISSAALLFGPTAF